MVTTAHQIGIDYAKKLDNEDPLKSYRDQFHFPTQKNGNPFIYLCGNSLGLQPKSAISAIHEELEVWKTMGVKGHFHAKNPWIQCHEKMADAMANVVGAKPEEVVVMNTLTVNLHLMMISFYRPEDGRNKILIEAGAFPSDRYAVESQIRQRGLDPKECLLELRARKGETCLREEDIKAMIEQEGDHISLILMGNTNYYTGQYFDMKKISEWGHSKGCFVGFDCAHGAGNLPLNLHDAGCDFAVWCTYKYMNSGPGAIGGVFVHERHHHDKNIPRFTGWWGHNKETRFIMGDRFDPIPTVEAWQLSNAPIMAMAPVWASLQMFDQVGIENLRRKSISLTGYLEYLVKSLGEKMIEIITPADPEQRGCQLSIQVKNATTDLYTRISDKGVIVDWREPDVIRVAPAPMYNSYEDVFHFYSILKSALDSE